MTGPELKTLIAESVKEALAEVQTVQAASAKERKRVPILHPEDPASRKQRGKIKSLTGVYPCDTTGFVDVTKQAASDAIETLLNGKVATLDGQTLTPQ